MNDKPIQNPIPAFPPLEFPAGMEVEYVNLVRIAHSASEMVFDFAQLFPGNQKAQVQSRIIMSPLGAKLFFRALGENLSRFEAAFGEITIPSGGALANQLFRHNQSPDKPE